MSACDHCLSRRDFLAAGTAAALTTLLAACGDGATAPVSINATVRVSDYPALANVGGMARLSGTSTPVAVVRSATATFRAFSLVCPHEAGSVGISGAGFLCSNHGATFNASGTWTGGQRTTNLREFQVVFDATAGTLSISS